MKECQAPGLIGTCCRLDGSCLLKTQALAESEEKRIHILRKDIERMAGCCCHNEVTEIVQRRVDSKKSRVNFKFRTALLV